MRQKTKNYQNHESIDKKNQNFFPIPYLPTQMGSLSAKNASEKFSCLGTFKLEIFCISAVHLWRAAGWTMCAPSTR
jgi:hypothetical protein